jgi:hypothetical protein
MLTAPEWLKKRDGALKLGSDAATWYILLSGQPHYALTAAPTAGKFACHIKQTVNGQRLGVGSVYASADEALRGGLEELRLALGW